MDVFVFGICGGSGSGKTTLARRLMERCDPRSVSFLAFDAYYRDLAHLTLEQRRRCNFDHPDSLDTDLFLQHLDALSSGRDVAVPVYDFTTHTMTGRFQHVAAARLLVVEGILLLNSDQAAARLDYAVFLDVPEETRRLRRIQRDVAERGRTPEHALRQFRTSVTPMHENFVQPNRHRADRIFTGSETAQLTDELLELLALKVPSLTQAAL
ncbi:MAG: uridine kinase [Acidimicrobiaceae bacterium]|nr:uridine kinase [Acidimicrobiaceae bacterium]MCY4280290.1 uridine kinase [Acidimicrobiaceae bacterium]MCY4293718.1 uridine kinase [Acidimicrobiaceae bacterium]